ARARSAPGGDRDIGARAGAAQRAHEYARLSSVGGRAGARRPQAARGARGGAAAEVRALGMARGAGRALGIAPMCGPAAIRSVTLSCAARARRKPQPYLLGTFGEGERCCRPSIASDIEGGGASSGCRTHIRMSDDRWELSHEISKVGK